MCSVVSNKLPFLSTATVLEWFLHRGFLLSCVLAWPPGSGGMDPDPVNEVFYFTCVRIFIKCCK